MLASGVNDAKPRALGAIGDRSEGVRSVYESWESLSLERAAQICGAFQVGIAEDLFPRVREQLKQIREHNISTAADQSEDIRALCLDIKSKALEFTAQFDARSKAVSSHRAELVQLIKLGQEMEQMISAAYKECLATGSVRRWPLLISSLEKFEAKGKQLAVCDAKEALVAFISGPQNINLLKVLTQLEAKIIKICKVAEERLYAVVEGCGELVDGAISFCEHLANNETILGESAAVIKRWHAKYAGVYIKGSSEVWAADQKRFTPQLQIEQELKINRAVLSLYRSAASDDAKAESLAKGKNASERQLLQRAEELLACGELRDSIVYAKAALHLRSSNHSAYILMGRSYHRLDLPQLAFHAYESAIIVQPSNPLAYERLSDLVEKRPKLLKEMSIALQRASKLHSGVLELDLQNVLCLVKCGELLAASSEISSLEQRYSKSGDIKYARALLAMAQGDTVQAKRELLSALNVGVGSAHRQATSLLELGKLSEQQGPVGNLQAKEYYRKAVEAKPDAIEGYRALSKLSSSALISIPEFNAFAKKFQTAQSYIALAELQERARQDEAAISSLQKARALSPSSSTPLVKLGNIYERRGDLRAAYEAYLNAQKLYPTNVEIEERIKKFLEQAPRLLDVVPNIDTQEHLEQAPVISDTVLSKSAGQVDILEGECVPQFNIDLPPVIVEFFASNKSKCRELLELQAALARASTREELEAYREDLREFIRKCLKEQSLGLTELLTVTEPGSSLNVAHGEAHEEIKLAYSHIAEWLDKVRIQPKISKESWNSLSLKIYRYLDPYSFRSTIQQITLQLSNAASCAQKLDPTSAVFSELVNFDQSFAAAMKSAVLTWAELCKKFNRSGQSLDEVQSEVKGMMSSLDRAKKLLELDYMRVSKSTAAGLDYWLLHAAALISNPPTLSH